MRRSLCARILVFLTLSLCLASCRIPNIDPTPVPALPTRAPIAAADAPTALAQAPQPAAATEAAAPQASSESDSEAILTVLGQPYTQAELEALPQASVKADDAVHTGVVLSALVAAADAEAETVAIVGSDGYAANLNVAELTDQCVLAYVDDKLNAVLPGMSKASWVRDVVEVRAGKPSAPEGEAAAPATPGERVAFEGGPLTLTDAAGRTVTLETVPQRLVVVGRGPHMSLHILYMFEEGRQRLVGTESRSATASNFLPFVDPAFAEVPTLDANPNVEQVVALAPDLVIIKGITEDKIATALTAVDVPVLYVGLETVEQFFVDLANIGAVLNNSQRADEIAAFYRGRIDRLNEGVADLAEEDKPSVLLIEYSDRGGKVAVQVPARSWMQTVEVQMAGGHPVWLDAAAPTDGWTVCNLEQIARWDPDQIYVVIWYTLDPQDVIDGLKSDPQWSALKAVKSGNLYAFPQDIFGWDQPEPRWILGMTWLAHHIDPVRFADIDMDAELMAYFGELYGMNDANIERDILPRVRMDVH